MTEAWNDHAEGWDDNADVNLYADRAFASLVAQTGIGNECWKSTRVLDFGCGTGLLAEKVAPHVHELVAVDTSVKMIAVLKNKDVRNVTAVHSDILADDFQFEGNLLSDFDLIYASSVCSFLPDYENAVMALTRLLKRGGHFVQWDWQASDGDDFGLSKNQIRGALNKAQLGSIRVERAFAIEADEQTLPVLIGAGVL